MCVRAYLRLILQAPERCCLPKGRRFCMVNHEKVLVLVCVCLRESAVNFPSLLFRLALADHLVVQIAVIDDSTGLEFGSFQSSGFHDDNVGSQAGGL